MYVFLNILAIIKKSHWYNNLVALYSNIQKPIKWIHSPDSGSWNQPQTVNISIKKIPENLRCQTKQAVDKSISQIISQIKSI